ncbi:TSUP family transporter [Corynebacterium pyruviciproducens]
MLALGRHDPRRIVGTVNAAEFLVTASATIGFAAGMWDAIITYWPLILALLIGVLIAAPIAAWALSRFNPTFLGVLVGALLVSLNLPRVFGLYTLWPLQAAIVVLGLVLGGRCNRYERAHRTARSAHPVSRKVQEPKSLVIPVS